MKLSSLLSYLVDIRNTNKLKGFFQSDSNSSSNSISFQEEASLKYPQEASLKYPYEASLKWNKVRGGVERIK